MPKTNSLLLLWSKYFRSKKEGWGNPANWSRRNSKKTCVKSSHESSFKEINTTSQPLTTRTSEGDGCETVVHNLGEVMKDNNSFVLEVHFPNASNLTNRGTSYNELLLHFPELAHWVSTCYRVKVIRNFGN